MDLQVNSQISMENTSLGAITEKILFETTYLHSMFLLKFPGKN